MKTVRRDGNAAEEIMHIADEEKVDAIVIGSTGTRSVKEFLLGGLSYKVVRMQNARLQLLDELVTF